MRHILLAVVIALAAACAHVDTTPKCPASTRCDFDGVADVLGRGKTVHLLIVHGMGPHSIGFSSELVETLTTKMELVSAGGGGVRRIPNPIDCSASAILSVRRFIIPNTGKQLLVHEVTWSPVVDSLKQALEYDSYPARSERRLILNRGLKRDLINARLADPVLYIGHRGRAMRYPVEYTLCSLLGGGMLRDRCVFGEQGMPGRAFDFPTYPSYSKDDSIVIITFSLGSKLTFDAIQSLLQDEEAPAAATSASVAQNGDDLSVRGRLRGKIATFFMLANQLPLLELAERDVFQEGTIPLAELGSELRLRDDQGKPAFSVVAISDPNDLLSYSISDTFALLVPNIQFTNVSVNLGRRYLGLVANPLGAHTRHEKSPIVINYVLGGFHAR